ncbi:MAG: GtrA family protein [Firmicutes bacterium]|nr:GtrA family protein [Bacillota bacterium]
MQTIKTLFTEKKDALWELVRYVVAGALTTAVSLFISYGLYFALAAGGAPAMPEGKAFSWVVDVINLATTAQVTVANVIAWIAAVLFAFWINRKMVFRVEYHDPKSRFKAFFQFVSARVLTLLLFGLGLAALLSVLGTPNIFSRVIVLVLVIVFNYIASKFWIFKRTDTPHAHP